MVPLLVCPKIPSPEVGELVCRIGITVERRKTPVAAPVSVRVRVSASFPEGAFPWTFSLFHCSSPHGGGALPPALPYGVRTFLSTRRRAAACTSAPALYHNLSLSTINQNEISADDLKRHGFGSFGELSRIFFIKQRQWKGQISPLEGDRHA
jgi:hypothetical protein